MSFPYVTRATAEFWRQAALSAEHRATALTDQLTAERDRYERLVEKMSEMQRSGFTAREPVRFQPTLPTLPEPILTAILARSPGLQSEIGRGLVEYAVAELERGTGVEQVETAIWNGGGG